MSSDPNSNDPQQGDRSQGLGETLRDTAPYLTLGIQLAATVIVFFLIGWWLDSRNDDTVIFRLVGLLVGSAGGIIKFVRTAGELSKKEKSSKPESRED